MPDYMAFPAAHHAKLLATHRSTPNGEIKRRIEGIDPFPDAPSISCS